MCCVALCCNCSKDFINNHRHLVLYYINVNVLRLKSTRYVFILFILFTLSYYSMIFFNVIYSFHYLFLSVSVSTTYRVNLSFFPSFLPSFQFIISLFLFSSFYILANSRFIHCLFSLFSHIFRDHYSIFTYFLL